MEYSKVTALDEEEKVTQKRRASSVSYHYLYPCDLLEEALRALFMCFGLDDNKSHADEELEPESSTTGANPAKTDPSTPELQVAEPTEDAADPPSSIPETTEIASASARVVRTPIGSGRGPQIN
ncbi:hypothetical protein ACLB2K_016594 [Fragaria x ananassa]